MDLSRYMSVAEYARRVGRSRQRVAFMCKAGGLPGAVFHAGRWLIPAGTPFPVYEPPGRVPGSRRDVAARRRADRAAQPDIAH